MKRKRLAAKCSLLDTKTVGGLSNQFFLITFRDVTFDAEMHVALRRNVNFHTKRRPVKNPAGICECHATCGASLGCWEMFCSEDWTLGEILRIDLACDTHGKPAESSMSGRFQRGCGPYWTSPWSLHRSGRLASSWSTALRSESDRNCSETRQNPDFRV